MHILGIGSATKAISIGLIDEEKVLVETTVSGAQVEKIIFYVSEAGIEPKQIDGVAVTVGPGSYSGLRGGLATAKSLSQSLNVPLVGVSTLEAIAYNLVDIEGTVAVLFDARADEYNFALFGASRGKLKRLTNDLVIKLEVLMEKLSKIEGDIWVVGNVKAVKGKTKGNIHFADETHCHLYGVNVARLGLNKISAGLWDDPLNLVPQYSHRPNIREYNVD